VALHEVKAVLFDLDDTLIDWWGSLTTTLGRVAHDEDADVLLEHVRSQFWERHPEHDFVWHRNTWQLFEDRRTAWREVLTHLHPADLDMLIRRFEDDLWVGFFPDVVPTLDRLTDRTRLAVLSNNHLIDREAKRLRLHDWFEFAMCPKDCFKPTPDAFHQACVRLGLAAHDVAYVGDSVRADALGALDAGLVPIWVDRWNDPWHERPNDITRVGSLSEIPDLLGIPAFD
jgi:putative hydrolase of the HAD superfamily